MQSSWLCVKITFWWNFSSRRTAEVKPTQHTAPETCSPLFLFVSSPNPWGLFRHKNFTQPAFYLKQFLLSTPTHIWLIICWAYTKPSWHGVHMDRHLIWPHIEPEHTDFYSADCAYCLSLLLLLISAWTRCLTELSQRFIGHRFVAI